MTLLQYFSQADGVGRAVGLMLLVMSVSSWVLILWKTWLLRRAAVGITQAVAAFWRASGVDSALAQVQAFDTEGMVLPMIAAARETAPPQTLGSQPAHAAQLTRQLRGTLQVGLERLQHGQIVLATVGSTAPFVGLLGTVWGIYHALLTIAGAGHISIDKLAGPVGESLIMTAAGLAVAIPAVLAYNVHGRIIVRLEALLEGFAHDLREWRLEGGA